MDMTSAARVTLFILIPFFLGTTYIVKENGVEVKRWDEPDGLDRITTIEDGKVQTTRTARPRKINTETAEIRKKASDKIPQKGLPKKVEYHPNGKVRSETLYKGGRRHGKYILYYETGRKKITRNYKEGKLDGWALGFDPKGKLAARGNYRQGQIHGLAQVYNPMLKKTCAALYWKGRYILPLLEPSCTDVGGIMHAVLMDEVIYFDKTGKESS